jgi:predicted amidophosphoribosyltransferase
LGIPINTKSLKRKLYTESQTSFDIDERRKNIEKAFVVKNKNRIEDKSILLVDDVMTTGATVREAAKSLLSSGAKKVFAVSAAIAE